MMAEYSLTGIYRLRLISKVAKGTEWQEITSRTSISSVCNSRHLSEIDEDIASSLS